MSPIISTPLNSPIPSDHLTSFWMKFLSQLTCTRGKRAANLKKFIPAATLQYNNMYVAFCTVGQNPNKKKGIYRELAAEHIIYCTIFQFMSPYVSKCIIYERKCGGVKTDSWIVFFSLIFNQTNPDKKIMFKKILTSSSVSKLDQNINEKK